MNFPAPDPAPTPKIPPVAATSLLTAAVVFKAQRRCLAGCGKKDFGSLLPLSYLSPEGETINEGSHFLCRVLKRGITCNPFNIGFSAPCQGASRFLDRLGRR